jgi:hypothetical protein
MFYSANIPNPSSLSDWRLNTDYARGGGSFPSDGEGFPVGDDFFFLPLTRSLRQRGDDLCVQWIVFLLSAFTRWLIFFCRSQIFRL